MNGFMKKNREEKDEQLMQLNDMKNLPTVLGILQYLCSIKLLAQGLEPYEVYALC